MLYLHIKAMIFIPILAFSLYKPYYFCGSCYSNQFCNTTLANMMVAKICIWYNAIAIAKQQ